MKFIEPEWTDLFNKFSNNDKLRKFLTKNKALVTKEDFYDIYGYKDKSKIDSFVYEENKTVYSNLTDLFLKNEKTLKTKEIQFLVNSGFLKEEIKTACGFDSKLILNYDFYWELFFTYKYCYTDSFFQNNWENFIPLCDFEEMTNNESATAFMDAVMKEFDKLDNILKKTKDFKDYKEIPFEYINYLSQLLGLEQKTFMMGSDMEAQYRVLAENIIDVYRLKGTTASWELLFNFLGFNVTLEEYFFDRRRYFTKNGMNLELSSADVKSFKYYLTTVDPRLNYKEELATSEIVTDSDISEVKNLKNFDSLVDEYGLMCVLGYDDGYIKTKTEISELTGLTIEGAQEFLPYEKDIYKYFKTNYLRIKPSLKFATANFSMDQLYQLTCLLNFLTPEFCQREMYIIVDIGENSEKLIMNYSRDTLTDDFYMLDSESWDQSFSEKYLVNYEKYVNSSNSYSIAPIIKNDIGEEKEYMNSLGMTSHVANGKYYNVFFNPLSEKIQIINSTKYWGDKIKIEDSTGNIYPVWRTDLNYSYNSVSHYATPSIMKNGSVVKELYLPKDSNLLPTKFVEKNWTSIIPVDLNGFEKESIKRLIRNMNNYIEIKWKTDLPISIFVKNEFTKEELEKYNISKEELKTHDKFFEKDWKVVSNFTWERYGSPIAKNGLEVFLKNHTNVINYDYINKQLFCDNDFTNLGFSEDNSYYKINSHSASSNARKQVNNKLAENLLLAMDGSDCYFISSNASNKEYYIYKSVFKTSFNGKYVYKFRPEPDYRITNSRYIYPTYNSLLNSINKTGTEFIYDKTGENVIIESSESVNFYVTADDTYYKPMLDLTGTKIIIHSQGLAAEPPTLELSLQKSNDVKKANKLGSFYYYNAFKNDNFDKELDETYNQLKTKRKPILMQYKYKNIHKNDLIYSTYDQKLYVLTSNGVFTFDDSVKNFSLEKYEVIKNKTKVSEEESKCLVNSSGNVFGINEVNFYGRLKLCDDGIYRIYEYDKDYKGFSEEDDNDNYLLNNYEREVSWEELGIQNEIINRPIKEKTDRKFDELNDNNSIANNILKEIFGGLEDKFNRSDLISWEL